MKHHFIASLEWRSVCLRVVGVCLMALAYAKMFTCNLLGETSMRHDTFGKLWDLSYRLWDEEKLKIEW